MSDVSNDGDYDYHNLYASSFDSDASVDWDDMTDVIQPIPDYMAAILAEMRRRYNHSRTRFHGEAALLRWRSEEEDDEIQTCFTHPNDMETDGNEFYVGRCWMPYETSGTMIRPFSPAWSLFLEIGVVKTDMNAGMQFSIQINSFPNEHFRENLYHEHHMVRSMEEWATFKRDILDGLMPELFKRVEDEVEFGFSEESTEPNSSDDGDDEMEESDDGEM